MSRADEFAAEAALGQMAREGALGKLIDIISARGAAQRIVALLRHSTREEIVGLTVEDAVMAPLTLPGRQLALDLGRRLPPDRPLRLYYSEVPRCVDTAEQIGAGFEKAGGQVLAFRKKTHLAASFIKDPSVVAREFGLRGPRAFVDAWLAGEIDAEALDPPDRAAQSQLDAMMEELTEDLDPGEPGVDLHISHDVNVVALLHLMFDVGDRTLPWPGYLEGVVVEAGVGPPWTGWYHDRIAKLQPVS
jgi:broad specificity phosphatase PhoE